MFRKTIRDFIICGITGWCMEIAFTAFHSFRRQKYDLTGTTSLWMFPIYGSAVLLKPFFYLLRKCRTGVRGTIYAGLIFAAEYLSGSLLKKHNLCPWNYRRCRFQVGSLIRLDFLPLWFLTGLMFEKILQPPIPTCGFPQNKGQD